MKLTNPLVIIAVVIAALLATALLLKPAKAPPPQTLQLPAPAGMHDTVVINPDADKGELGAKLREIEQRDQAFLDATKLAANTMKLALSPVVGDMQKQLRANQQYEFPKCMQPAKDYWIAWQQGMVDAFFAFMDDGNAADMSGLEDAQRARRNFEMVLDSCKGVAEGRP